MVNIGSYAFVVCLKQKQNISYNIENEIVFTNCSYLWIDACRVRRNVNAVHWKPIMFSLHINYT